MRAIVIIVIAAILGYFGYQYAVNGRDPHAIVTGADSLGATGIDTGAAAPAAEAATAPDAVAPDPADDAAAEAAPDEAVPAADTPAEEDDTATAAPAPQATDNPEAEAAPDATDSAASDTPATDAAAPEAAAADTPPSDSTAPAPAATEAPTSGGSVDATVDAAGTMTPGAGAEAAADVALPTLLTQEGFNADAVIARIADSDLSVVQKTTLTAAVRDARENPELLPATITRLREAMGL
ncbi:hypothetical protein SAMN05444339_102233 [Loktanella atrilutea]|uniref:Uncharacterized protein n=1 Tax=Loktanella atrilutea TaxID=366533 RepID=A0A1M4WUC2_LOKAT|nr:hypothetical protein [Loktanella atrilutea]SHE84798.1 hypothetical protein SAMN05444339_102233 [Loktanella atrilutea]